MPIGARRVHLCARCLGLYPALGLALAARLAGVEAGRVATLVALVLPLAGAAGWVAEQTGRDLSKPVRLASGALLGLGLGWVLGLHFRSPWPRELLELGAGLGVALLAGAVLRAARLDDGAIALVDPEAAAPATHKNGDVPFKNEVDPGSS